MQKHWTTVIKEIFPGADILDAALKYPVTKQGWIVDLPTQSYWRDRGPDHKLFVCLQDWLTQGQQYPQELENSYEILRQHSAPMDQIIFLVEPQGIAKDWPSDRFKVIEFSGFLYEHWCSYKDAEDVLRDAFSRDKKSFEFNWVCPQRIYKPHRAALHSVLKRYSHGNISLQSKGHELRHPSLSFEDYNSEYNNLTNLLAMRDNYNTALMCIISESQYSEKYGVITEKTFNSIVAGMPFLVAGHRGALADITEYGFISYPNFFNESYDQQDNRNRIKTLIEHNNNLIRKPLSAVEMQTYYDECSNIIEYNRNYFFEQFGDQLISELRMDLLSIWGN